MKNKEYNIKIHSIFRFFIAFIVLLCSSLVFLGEFTAPSGNRIISIFQFLAVLISSFYLAHLIGLARAKVSLTEEGFTHTWQRRFFLSREKNIKISWDIIDNYVFQEDRTFDSFIINLTTNKRYKINRLNLIAINDDFNQLLKDFPKLSNKFKKGMNTENKMTIKEGKTIYETIAFKWVFYIMIVGFLIIITTKIINPESGSSWSSLGTIGFGLLFYGAMIKERKSK